MERNNNNSSPTNSHDSFFDEVEFTNPQVQVICKAKFPMKPGSYWENSVKSSVFKENKEQPSTSKADKGSTLFVSINEEVVPCSQEVVTVNHLETDESEIAQLPTAASIREELPEHWSLEPNGDTLNHLGSEDSDLTQPPPTKRIKQEVVDCSQEVAANSVNHLGSLDSFGQTPTDYTIKKEVPDQDHQSFDVLAGSQDHIDIEQSTLHLAQQQTTKTIKKEPDEPVTNAQEVAITLPQGHFAHVADEVSLRYDKLMNYYYPGVESGFQGSSIIVNRGSPVPSLDSLESIRKNNKTNERKENQQTNEFSMELNTSNRNIGRNIPLFTSTDVTLPPLEYREKSEVVEDSASDISLEAVCGSQLSQETESGGPPGTQKSRPSLIRNSSMDVQFDEESQRPCPCGAICICLLRKEIKN